MFVVKQTERKFWQTEQPAFVFRATRSPNFGVRLFDQVAVFATKAAALAWVAAQPKSD
jgi:hypothetical protein